MFVKQKKKKNLFPYYFSFLLITYLFYIFFAKFKNLKKKQGTSTSSFLENGLSKNVMLVKWKKFQKGF